jgi:hypothetical protein
MLVGWFLGMCEFSRVSPHSKFNKPGVDVVLLLE